MNEFQLTKLMFPNNAVPETNLKRSSYTSYNVVPKNIHTPPQRVIENYKEEGGLKWNFHPSGISRGMRRSNQKNPLWGSMSLKASCFAVKQQVYGHFLATRIFHLATEKRISVATWRPHKKVNFGPWPIVSTFCAHLTLINIFTQRQVHLVQHANILGSNFALV